MMILSCWVQWFFNAVIINHLNLQKSKHSLSRIWRETVPVCLLVFWYFWIWMNAFVFGFVFAGVCWLHSSELCGELSLGEGHDPQSLSWYCTGKLRYCTWKPNDHIKTRVLRPKTIQSNTIPSTVSIITRFALGRLGIESYYHSNIICHHIRISQ